MLLDQIFDAIGNLCLTIILIFGPPMLVGWIAFRLSDRRRVRWARQYRVTRQRLGYDT